MQTLIAFMFVLALSIQVLGVEVQGHRGSRWTHPENTIAGLEEALSSGADVLEFDLGMTSDGILILSHDPVINPSICRHKSGMPLFQKWVIREKTLSELKSLDCGAMINPRFPFQRTILGTEMPTLEEVFKWIRSNSSEKAKKIRFNIETKISSKTASPTQFAKEFVRVVKKHGMKHRTVMQSFDFRSLEEARRIDPTIEIALLVSTQSWDEIDKEAKGLEASIISPPHRWVTEEIMSKAKASKYKVIPWTANAPRDWKRLIRLGVDDYYRSPKGFGSLFEGNEKRQIKDESDSTTPVPKKF